jgi:hypothetical protein
MFKKNLNVFICYKINIYCSKFSPSFRHLRLQVKWRELNNIYLRFASENFRIQKRNSQDKMSRRKIQLKFPVSINKIGILIDWSDNKAIHVNNLIIRCALTSVVCFHRNYRSQIRFSKCCITLFLNN